jgi:hypothetical protein
MTTYQCPRCELRFGYSSELKGHLDNEHKAFRVMAGSLEDDLLGACHCNHHGRRVRSVRLSTRR